MLFAIRVPNYYLRKRIAFGPGDAAVVCYVTGATSVISVNDRSMEEMAAASARP